MNCACIRFETDVWPDVQRHVIVSRSRCHTRMWATSYGDVEDGGVVSKYLVRGLVVRWLYVLSFPHGTEGAIAPRMRWTGWAC